MSVQTILEVAARHGADVIVPESQAERAPGAVAIADTEFVDRVDTVFSLGGDGTMLGTMRRLLAHPVPVLGVNHGNLGFLVEITPSKLDRALERLLSGDYIIEPHSCLEVTSTGPTPELTVGFNDVALVREGRIGAISVDLSVNDQRYGYYRCDALVIATPTGSTAYNYAAGGPVLSPSADAMVVTPVAPMAGITRPIVLGPYDAVHLQVAEDTEPVTLVVDGSTAADLPATTIMTTQLRRDAAHIVRFAPGTHAHRSRIKLSLLDLPLRPDQLVELIPEEVREHIDHRQMPEI